MRGALRNASSFSVMSNIATTARISIVANRYVPRNFFSMKTSRSFNPNVSHDRYLRLGLCSALECRLLRLRYESLIFLMILFTSLQPSCHIYHHLLFPLLEVAGKNVRPGFFDKPQIECEIMYRGDLHSENLMTDEQVSQICF